VKMTDLFWFGGFSRSLGAILHNLIAGFKYLVEDFLHLSICFLSCSTLAVLFLLLSIYFGQVSLSRVVLLLELFNVICARFLGSHVEITFPLN